MQRRLAPFSHLSERPVLHLSIDGAVGTAADRRCLSQLASLRDPGKPTIGLVPFLYRPSRRGLLAVALATAISVLIQPSWPIWWLGTVLLQGGPQFIAPLLMPGGFLLALVLLAWRAPQGRALAAAAAIPRHVFWYDSLFLRLIPDNWQQGLALSAASWIGYLGWLMTLPAVPRDDFAEHVTSCPWQIACLYLPALALVL